MTTKQNHPIDSHTVLQRNPDQLFTMIDDEVVMLNIQYEEYLNLNSHASYNWQLLQTSQSFSELTDQLCSAYNVEKKVCVKDTMEFIKEFVEKEIIQIVHE